MKSKIHLNSIMNENDEESFTFAITRNYLILYNLIEYHSFEYEI